MMMRRYRLRRRADFAHLRRVGRVYDHRLLRLSVVENGLAHNRYGFVTSKRLGNAVKRNRARRLLRESIRQLHTTLRPGFDVVLVARGPLVGRPLAAAQAALYELFRAAELLESDGE